MISVKSIEIIGLRDVNTDDERVLLRAKETSNLNDYLIVNTKHDEAGKLTVLNQHVYWFQSGIIVNTGDLIRVYTLKHGEYKTYIAKYGEEKVRYHDFYWGLSKPVWDQVTSDAAT
ncbi:MAG TPA: hypothetical protein VMW43_09795, partial [Bacteroidota bacterium]|nr:hypothetical protein [Bacteroidota bacterium]